MSTEYTVIVGNIGEVYTGRNMRDARKVFTEYVKQSEAEYGRASGEPVTLCICGEPVREYLGTLSEDTF